MGALLIVLSAASPATSATRVMPATAVDACDGPPPPPPPPPVSPSFPILLPSVGGAGVVAARDRLFGSAAAPVDAVADRLADAPSSASACTPSMIPMPAKIMPAAGVFELTAATPVIAANGEPERMLATSRDSSRVRRA